MRLFTLAFMTLACLVGTAKNPLRFSATSHGGQSLPNIRCSHVCPHPWYPWPPERPEMMVVLQPLETANSFANLRPTLQHLELRWRRCFARTLGSFLHMQVHNFKLWNARVALTLILSSIQLQRTLGVMPTLDLFSQHFCSCFPTHWFGAAETTELKKASGVCCRFCNRFVGQLKLAWGCDHAASHHGSLFLICIYIYILVCSCAYPCTNQKCF